MTFEQLLYLKKVYEHHSIALASESLHITRQALSASLRKLEQELAVPLFIRTVKGIDLTPKGHEVLMFAESILEQQQAFMQQFYATHTPSSQSGYIHVVSHYLPRTIIFPELTAYFINHYPNIQINDLPIADRQQLLLQITDDEQDIGFTYQMDHPLIDLSPLPDNHNFHPLVVIRPYIWCSITSPIGYRQKLNLADVIHYPILQDKHTGNFLEETIFKLFGMPPVKYTLPADRDSGVLEAYIENNQLLLWEMGTASRSVYQYLNANPHLRRIPVQLPKDFPITIGYVLSTRSVDNPCMPILLDYLDNLALQ